MSSSSARPSERRSAILGAATRVLAQHGLRGLTHRAVDREAGVPPGTTSYHASTRQALLELVVEHLVVHSALHIEAGNSLIEFAEQLSPPAGVDELIDPMSEIIETLASHADTMRARYALLVGLEPGELHTALTTESLGSQVLVPAATKAFTKLGVTDPERQAKDLVDISDALIWQRTTMGTNTDIRAILRRYLVGVLAA